MRRWIPFASLAVVLFASPTTRADDDARTIAEKITTEGAKTFDACDAQAMTAQYLDDARLTVIARENGKIETQIHQGKSEVRDFYAKLFEKPETIKSRNTVDRATFLGADALSIDGTFDVNTLDPNSFKIPFHQVRVKRDGKWRVLLMEIAVLPKE